MNEEIAIYFFFKAFLQKDTKTALQLALVETCSMSSMLLLLAHRITKYHLL